MSERSRAVRRSFYGRLAVEGFLLIFLSVPVAVIGGNAEAAFGFGPPAVLSLIVALVLWLTGRGIIVALVWSILALLLFAIGEVVGGLPALGHPEGFSDFVPALLRAVGSVLAFTGTLLTQIQTRRARGSPTALRGGTRAEKRLLLAGAAVLVIIAVLSAVFTYTTNADLDAPPGAVVVKNRGDEFYPRDVRLDIGRNQVLVVNNDSYSHTFSVDDLDLDVYIGPRANRLITFNAAREGKFDLYCAVTGHEDMIGTIEIST